MTAKEFLMRARRLQARIDQLEEARRTAWERSTSVTAAPGGTAGAAGAAAHVSRKTAAYGEYVAQIDDERDRLAEIKADTLKIINKVSDNTLATLLIAYYINGQTWEQTAVSIHYSYYRTVHDKHPQALAEVEKLLQKM